MKTLITIALVAGAVAAHAEDADDEQTANILAITSTYVTFCKSLPPKAQITLDYLRSGISQEAREHAGTLAAEATQLLQTKSQEIRAKWCAEMTKKMDRIFGSQ